jgi:hypothetical protein
MSFLASAEDLDAERPRTRETVQERMSMDTSMADTDDAIVGRQLAALLAA